MESYKKQKIENINISFDLLCNCSHAINCEEMILELCDTVSIKEIKKRCKLSMNILNQLELGHYELEKTLKNDILLEFDVQQLYKQIIEKYIIMLKTNTVTDDKLYNINVLMQLLIVWG